MVGRIASKCLRHNLAPIVPNLGAHRRRLRGGALATPRHSLGCGETEASQGVAFRRWGAWWVSCVSAVRSTRPTPCNSSAPSSSVWSVTKELISKSTKNPDRVQTLSG